MTKSIAEGSGQGIKGAPVTPFLVACGAGACLNDCVIKEYDRRLVMDFELISRHSPADLCDGCLEEDVLS